MRLNRLTTEAAWGHANVFVDLPLAKREMSIAWEQYKQSTIRRFRDGLDFGRACQEWQARYTAQGSRRGKGFEHLLEELSIPKTTAYRWIRRYEMKIGLRATRNEVRDNPGCNIRSSEKRMAFNFLLTDELREQFDEDVEILGGRKKVAEMFFDFVSQKASERREVNAKKKKVVRYKEECVKRLGVGALVVGKTSAFSDALEPNRILEVAISR